MLGIAIPFVLMLTSCGGDEGRRETYELAFTCGDAHAYLEAFGTVEATLARLQSPGWSYVPELVDSASAWAAFTPQQQTAIVNSLHVASEVNVDPYFCAGIGI